MTQKKKNVPFDALNDKDRILRGQTWKLDLALYTGIGGNCTTIVKGDPLDLTSFQTSLEHEGKVVGTDRNMPVDVTIDDPGSATSPARMTVRVNRDDIERVYEEGALQSFLVTVWAGNVAGDRIVLYNGKITVVDSARGSVR